VVETWWLSDNFSGVRSERNNRQIPLEADFKNRPVKVHGKDVVIESVQLELRTVQGKKDTPCLVVRLRHAEGEPVLVRLAEPKVEGEEELLYSGANKCTAIFWPIERSQVENLKLNLISLKEVKEKAGSNHTRMELPVPAR
jgi:hypothetical protein